MNGSGSQQQSDLLITARHTRWRLPRVTSGALALLLCPAALAEASDAIGGQFLAVLLPLLVVLGALLGALVWLNKGRGLYRSTGPLKLLQVVAVSSRERVVVLDAGKRIMVVGVASGRVSLLSMLDPTDIDNPTG